MALKFVNDTPYPYFEETLTKEEIEGRLSNQAVRLGMQSRQELIHRVIHGQFYGTPLEAKVQQLLFLLGWNSKEYRKSEDLRDVPYIKGSKWSVE